ncbi:PHD finger domain-containing protein [Aspergillus aculeatinus CBS 121060]|uniref:Uncharacterized protein n=1 Tax=Aspergillus aculeatinus CBS 121060 TaxID=1448322 RepID=A0ACD1HAZ2_9EURO|nr:hypothetical protein BO66DRAFT_420290 [Aspergillus aculeatinus CBS 121060]RAH70582.1 hypothetical protein BO66DRAFT_420290 [Aspergillus aculeatinus CBS 121060]
MGIRGLWNVHVDGKPEDGTMAVCKINTCIGKWYRLFHEPTGRITSPDAPATLQTVRKVVSTTAIEDWESIPFPITSPHQLRLYPSLSTLDDILVDNEDINKQHRTQYTETGLTISPTLKINIAKPTSLTELQLRLFTDFDTEGIPKNIIGEIPIGSYSIPKWSAPSENIFWLHGFLVTVYSASDTLENAVQETQRYLDKEQCKKPVIHVILISLGHVTFVEITGTGVQYSPTIPLVINSSAIQPSPGFRALTSVLSSNPWKIPHREKWGINIPTEILDRILKALAPKDVISFARASTAVDRWYYSSLPQLDRVLVRSFDFSIPCCGERHKPNGDGVSCSTCYTWYHRKCASLSSESQGDGYLCTECQQNGASNILEAGGIYRARRKIGSKPSCKVTVDGEVKVLNLRTAKLAARRPERFSFRGLSIPPNDLNYTIRFNRVFSGLAYGLDEV